MLPNDGALSTQVLPAEYLVPLRQSKLISYSKGGIAIGDTSMGLMYQNWRSGYNGTHIVLYTEDDIEHPVIAVDDVEHIAFTFDQNMNPLIIYTADGRTYMYWYDPVQGAQTTEDWGVSYNCVQCTLDDPRPEYASDSDIIIAYINTVGELCYRVQRERYLIQHVITGGLTGRRLTQIGLTRNYRFRFRHVLD